MASDVRCVCPCHTHSGTYPPPCNVCGHDTREGRWVGGYRGWWEPNNDPRDEQIARLTALLAERDARIKTLENDLEHALASVGAFRQAVENVFAKAEEHEVDQGGMIVTYVLPCGPLHRAIGLTRGTDAGGKLLKRLGDTEAERDDLAARMAAAEAAIREALYDYDHGDDLGAIDRLRAALAAQEGRDDLPTE